MKNLILLFTFITLIYSDLKSQNSVDFSKERYEQGKISLSNYKKINASDIKILKDSIDFLDEDTKKRTRLSYANINYLKLQEGNNAGVGFFLGGTTMGLVILNVLISDNIAVREVDFSRILLPLGGGAAVGALIGYAVPKWKIYYLGNKTTNISIQPVFYSMNGLGASIKVSM
jgi:hypothetical protein